MSASPSLLSAALLGLLGVAAGGCSDEAQNTRDNDPSNEIDASAADDDSGPGEGDPDAGSDAGGEGPVVTEEIPGQRSYDSLAADCDKRGGYIQLHAACSGSNSCKGFSYGDWGEDAVLTEHTCAGLNGCTGLSCVVLPEDSGKTGAEVYEAETPPGGPSSCSNCHAAWEHAQDGTYLPPDLTKFKVWVLPGNTTRTIDNWLELSAQAQAGIVAFGKNNTLPDGSPIVSMKGYHQIFSRAEIERAVEHIRTLTPVLMEIGKPE